MNCLCKSRWISQFEAILETGLTLQSSIYLRYRSFAWNVCDSVLSFLFADRDPMQFVTINSTKRAIDGLIQLSIFIRCNGYSRYKFAVYTCDRTFYAGIRDS